MNNNTASDLYMHPETLKELRLSAMAHYVLEGFAAPAGLPGLLSGIPIYTSTNCPRYRKKWLPPTERFVEYEASDTEWLKYFGLGCEVDDTSKPAMFMMPRLHRGPSAIAFVS